MEKYVVEYFPRGLRLEIDEIGREIGTFWGREQYAEAEALFKQQYTLIRKVEERDLPEGKRFHKGSYLHSWGIAILRQKNAARVEEGSRKIFLAYVEDLLDYDNPVEVRRASAYNALTGNPLIRAEWLEILSSKVEDCKSRGQIPKNPEDVLPAHVKITLQQELPTQRDVGAAKVAKRSKQLPSKNIFIVHGQDEKPKLELARMLAKLGLNPIILSEQADKGKTIIEKLEQNSLDIGYAFVLLTPDDMAVPSSENLGNVHSPRARQNVILELGYFIGKLGRDRICCLYNDNVELPSDIHGVVYKRFNKSIEECFKSIAEELKAAGYKIRL